MTSGAQFGRLAVFEWPTPYDIPNFLPAKPKSVPFPPARRLQPHET